MCTNPLYGRGCSLAFVHAFGLADALRVHGDDFDRLAREFAGFTERELVPWFRSAVMQDAQARALREEVPAEDPRAFIQAVFREGLLPAMRTSPVVFRAFVRWFNLLVTPETLMADPDIVSAVMAAYEDRENRSAAARARPRPRRVAVTARRLSKAPAAAATAPPVTGTMTCALDEDFDRLLNLKTGKPVLDANVEAAAHERAAARRGVAALVGTREAVGDSRLMSISLARRVHVPLECARQARPPPPR